MKTQYKFKLSCELPSVTCGVHCVMCIYINIKKVKDNTKCNFLSQTRLVINMKWESSTHRGQVMLNDTMAFAIIGCSKIESKYLNQCRPIIN